MCTAIGCPGTTPESRGDAAQKPPNPAGSLEQQLAAHRPYSHLAPGGQYRQSVRSLSLRPTCTYGFLDFQRTLIRSAHFSMWAGIIVLNIGPRRFVHLLHIIRSHRKFGRLDSAWCHCHLKGLSKAMVNSQDLTFELGLIEQGVYIFVRRR